MNKTWQPIPRSLEYDLITMALRGGEIPIEYRLCRLTDAPAVSASNNILEAIVYLLGDSWTPKNPLWGIAGEEDKAKLFVIHKWLNECRLTVVARDLHAAIVNATNVGSR